MRTFFVGWLGRAALLLVFCMVPFAGRADDAKMLYIEYQLVAFGLSPDSFPAQPKKLWRVADTRLRLEEVKNPDTGEQRLVIVAQPDIWIIDRIAGFGRHQVDPGPTFKVKFPVFNAEGADEITALEMGREVEFFRERGAKDMGAKTVAGVECNESMIELGGRKLSLFTRKADGLPFQVSVLIGDTARAVRYLRYERELAVDKALFAPPAGVEIEEAKKP
jgi:hypothetical protein